MIDQLQTDGLNNEITYLNHNLNHHPITPNMSNMSDSDSKFDPKFNYHQRSMSNVSNNSNFSYNFDGANHLSGNVNRLTPGMNHQPKLSINSLNSVNSIIEPVTPPSAAPGGAASGGGSSYPESTNHIGAGAVPVSTTAATPAPASTSGNGGLNLNGDIDKDYLLSINKLPLSQLKGEILKLSKDQYGCRFLQKKIDENLISNYSIRFSNFEIIFNEIYLNLYELIIDPFGNYLIQKLIKYCSNENLNLILEILQSNLFQISINQHGTRALQKIIESLNLNSNYQLNLLIQGLKPFIIELIKDLNGNHVIQKILNKFKPIQCQFIYDSILNDLMTVATHKHGCCVLQKCLNHVTQVQLNQFVDEILNDYNFNKLINDQFGNYVLQYLISINNYQIHYKFFTSLVKFDLANYCNLKFSSNVIEKFLKNCYNNEYSNGEIKLNFINLKLELIHQILKNQPSLNKLINDPFGNYVIQTLIDNLINSNVDYRSANPKNLYLLVNPLPVNNETIKFEIINNYFHNCKIISSFGKRIQSKISLILNNQQGHHPHQQFASRSSFSSSPTNIENNVHSNVNNVPYFSNNLNSNPNINGHSNSNSFSSTRSNSYPGIHSRSNSFQYNGPIANSDYILDSQLSNNFSNMNLNYNYQGAHSVTPVQTPKPVSSGSFLIPQHQQGQMVANQNGSHTHTPLVNTPQTPLTNQNSYFVGYQGGNLTPNLNSNPNFTQTSTNMNPNYLKTPQIFSNVPVNDFIHDSNQAANYFR